MKSLKLGIGDRILVYKANMIIPQIASNLTCSDNIEIPSECPACKNKTSIESINDTQTLMCTNPDCPVKHSKGLTLFASRNALNIDGISEETILKFIEKGFIREYADFFKLERYKDQMISMDGFGLKSYENLIKSCENAKKTTLPRLLYGLGIENIGVANAKLIASFFDYDLSKIREASVDQLSVIDQVGEVIATAVYNFFHDENNIRKVDNVLEYLDIEIPQKNDSNELSGMTFVITGSLNHFDNRDQLKEIIESMGGKVSGSVSGNTKALINNDITSNSGKNKKAKELGVEIMSEDDFLNKYNINV